LNVLFDWRHKDSRIIRIEGRSHNRSSTSNHVKEVVLSSQLKNFLQGVNRKHKEKRQKGVSLPKTATMLDGRAGDAI
jgi:hypothetical protein